MPAPTESALDDAYPPFRSACYRVSMSTIRVATAVVANHSNRRSISSGMHTNTVLKLRQGAAELDQIQE